MTDEIANLESALDFEPVSGGGPDVTEFIGTVMSVTPRADEKYGGVRLHIVYEDLDIKAAPSPYDLPIYEVTVRKPTPNQWGRINSTNAYAILRASAAKVVTNLGDWRGLVGHRLHMSYTPEHTLYNKERGEHKGKAWEVLAVVANGAAPATAVRAQSTDDVAMGMLIGKTRMQFMTAAVRDAAVRSDGAFLQGITSGTWLAELEVSGKVVAGADGVYQKAG